MDKQSKRGHSKVNPLVIFGNQEGLVLENEDTKYRISKIVGSGAFGIVAFAVDLNTNEVVAIKRVIQDRRYKNRELQMMEMLKHQNVLELKNYFYSKVSCTEDLCLNVVMDYFPQNLHQLMHDYRRRLPIGYTRLFSYELARALGYIHSFGMCHRDIKPQNIMVNRDTGDLKLCDFGSAKLLTPDESNISYICSRYYRAPELIFGATRYSTAVDVWSFGCVVAEMIVGQPFFQGESASDQITRIMKILGSPTVDEVKAMNNESPYTRVPHVGGVGIEAALRFMNPPFTAVLMLIKVMQYTPEKRPTAVQLITDNFHKDLFTEGLLLPNGNPLPILTNYDENEWKRGEEKGVKAKMENFVEMEKKRINSQQAVAPVPKPSEENA
ncbi:protein kinase domain containing protein [Entamoeba histolytica HM-1:IMSS-B]|uniref:Protein kinase domain containing protein n=7 Tax=Entamoeba histolytica TaxID=5759 RepID=C4M5D4_ENTH1|nr:protein kinase domain containing protein [Entamoeba histolytica HM-1:IMSS]EMD44489.1 protein kinase domain containing protein [Entamoeba histolytica KU27]EMH72098.1 protein kinase domain containing protein [Entamoeba histolytica HM-1:IMSS-B]EMS14933.1 protein kinase domain containing protein [Entamoeba histolytica HM-3:IMSS]ENY64635.1 protein kinase domain containing protein [Entamoeba histolytica HM-1:IMSS-A]BAN39359.1 protein kinase domain containing protein [Entamoeba histolytica]|eukprot:XP_651793.1 protein kinase domain containing protein [Entamoeba histolytica HM-1:IMSS]